MQIGPQRRIDAGAIVAPDGYRVEALITGLSFPTAISFGPGGELYVAEGGGVGGQLVSPPRVLRIDTDRAVSEIGRLDHPIVGVVYRSGELLIAEDTPSPRILRVTSEGQLQIAVSGLPGGGDYGLSGLSLDASGALLFGMGTRTNSGVVGLDNLGCGQSGLHADQPGQDLTSTGVNYVTTTHGPGGAQRSSTGGFQPYGTRNQPDHVVKGTQRCGGAVFRVPLGSSEVERLAWGLRNPTGVASAPDGRIFATEGGMEERGSRPVASAPDNLWEIQAGSYYGWPDYASGVPVTDPRFRLPGHPSVQKLWKDAPAIAGAPAALLGVRSGVGRLDFSSSDRFGFAGQAFVALAGGWSSAAYATDDAPSGFRVVRVDARTGAVTEFLANRGGGPASAGATGGLERPFDVQFDPCGESLYVVDLGEVHLDRNRGRIALGCTGVVWRITPLRIQVTVARNLGGGVTPADLDDDDDDDDGDGPADEAVTLDQADDFRPEPDDAATAASDSDAESAVSELEPAVAAISEIGLNANPPSWSSTLPWVRRQWSRRQP